MVAPLPLNNLQIARAAEEMIAEYGSEALTKADERVKAYKLEGFDLVAKSWKLVREVIKDMQESGGGWPVGRQQGWGKPGMKLLRRVYPKHEFGEPAVAMLADVLLLVVVVGGTLVFLAVMVSSAP